jgi:hypothetical protein
MHNTATAAIAGAQPDDSPEAEEEARRLTEVIQQFGTGLQKSVDTQVGLKVELEKRWLDDLRHYNGEPDEETAKKLDEDRQKAKGSRIFVNLTRSKSNIAEAKWSDLVLPTDDRNWGMKVTPVPELVTMLESEEELETQDGDTPVDDKTGEPFKEKDIAAEAMKAAESAMKKMQDEIDDQLTEADYNSQNRKVIHDAVVIGTGILKGPMVEKRVSRAWIQDENGEWVMNTREDAKPTASRVDPWNFFPEMSATSWDDVEFTFERHLLTKKKVRNLLKIPGFSKEKIRDLLMTAPDAARSNISYLNQLRAINGINQIKLDNRYEIWEYHGPIDKEDLVACGCDGVDAEDPLEVYDGTVWFSHGMVLKVSLNHMDDDSLPYCILNWEADETSTFGFGVPYRMRHPQRVMNASWRMLLDNAGLSTGPQIVVNKEIVEPVNGRWELTPRKLWYMTDKKAKAKDAFNTFEIESHQQELSNIFEQAHRHADEETNVPQMQMGNIPGETQQPAMLKTLGGTAMWMSANNISMRRAVKNYDDNVTVPFITRMYDWNMQFNKKSDIKGDYQVDARGTSVLLVREMQARNLMELVNAALVLPGGPERIKTGGILGQFAKALQVTEGEVLYSDRELEANKEGQEDQPPDPETMKLQMQLQIAEMILQEKQIEVQGSYEREKIQQETELTKLAVQERTDIAKLQSDYGIKKYEADWSAKKFYDEIQIKREENDVRANIGLGGDG